MLQGPDGFKGAESALNAGEKYEEFPNMSIRFGGFLFDIAH